MEGRGGRKRGREKVSENENRKKSWQPRFTIEGEFLARSLHTSFAVPAGELE